MGCPRWTIDAYQPGSIMHPGRMHTGSSHRSPIPLRVVTVLLASVSLVVSHLVPPAHGADFLPSLFRAFQVEPLPNSLAMVDVDQDGNLDLLTCSDYLGLTVLTGSGNGEFDQRRNLPAESGSHGLVTDDFNNDGVIDVAFANGPSRILARPDPGPSPGIAILLGLGHGLFLAPRIYATDAYSNSLVTRDLDADGIVDLVATQGHSDRVAVLMGLGNGDFAPARFLTTLANSGPVAVGDVDGDGHRDLVVGYSLSNTLSIFSGDGTGGFGPRVDARITSRATVIVAADLDGDSREEILANYAGGDHVAIYSYEVDQSLRRVRDLGTGVPYDDPVNLIRVIDVNDDRRTDIVFVTEHDEFGGHLVVWSANADGSFGPPARILTASAPTGIEFGDVNGDGFTDVAISSRYGNNVTIILGDGQGEFGGGDGLTAPVTGLLDVADFNGDDRLDMVGTETADGSGFHQVFVSLQGPGGSYGPASGYLVWWSPVALESADVDGDGYLDLVVGGYSYNESKVAVLRGRGDGTFENYQAFPAGRFLTSVTSADLNGDGKADVVAADDDGRLAVFLGADAPMLLRPPSEIPIDGREYCKQVVARDLNQDARPDLIVSTGWTVRVLLAAGAGYLEGRSYPIGGFSTFLALGDLNDDGRLDVVSVNTPSEGGNNRISVFLNVGGGQLGVRADYVIGAGPDLYYGGSSTSLAALGDLSGDGSIDIAAINAYGNSIGLLLGNGDGAFQPMIELGETEYPIAIASADVNRDGLHDIVLTGFPTRILLGRGDAKTPILVSLAQRDARSGQVRMIWRFSESELRHVRIYKHASGRGWSLNQDVPSHSGHLLEYDDFEVLPGHRYGYRLFVVEQGAEALADEQWVEVPIGLALGLRVTNPSRGLVTAFISLPQPSPAILEVLDPAGRLVSRRDVGALGTGEHRVDVADHLAPGLYFLRLTQAGRTIQARSIVLR